MLNFKVQQPYKLDLSTGRIFDPQGQQVQKPPPPLPEIGLPHPEFQNQLKTLLDKSVPWVKASKAINQHPSITDKKGALEIAKGLWEKAGLMGVSALASTVPAQALSKSKLGGGGGVQDSGVPADMGISRKEHIDLRIKFFGEERANGKSPEEAGKIAFDRASKEAELAFSGQLAGGMNIGGIKSVAKKPVAEAVKHSKDTVKDFIVQTFRELKIPPGSGPNSIEMADDAFRNNIISKIVGTAKPGTKQAREGLKTIVDLTDSETKRALQIIDKYDDRSIKPLLAKRAEIEAIKPGPKLDLRPNGVVRTNELPYRKHIQDPVTGRLNGSEKADPLLTDLYSAATAQATKKKGMLGESGKLGQKAAIGIGASAGAGLTVAGGYADLKNAENQEAIKDPYQKLRSELREGEILVQDKKGNVGAIPKDEFDATIYIKL